MTDAKISSPASLPRPRRRRRNSNIRRAYLQNLGIDTSLSTGGLKGKYTKESPSAVVALKGKEERPIHTFLEYIGWYNDENPVDMKINQNGSGNSDGSLHTSHGSLCEDSPGGEAGVGIARKKRAKRGRLHFNEEVSVYYIPIHHELSTYERESMWYNRKAFRDMIETNLEAIYQEMEEMQIHEDSDDDEDDDRHREAEQVVNTETSFTLRYNHSVSNLSEHFRLKPADTDLTDEKQGSFSLENDDSPRNAAPTSSRRSGGTSNQKSWDNHFPSQNRGTYIKSTIPQENIFGVVLKPRESLESEPTVSPLLSNDSPFGSVSRMELNDSRGSVAAQIAPFNLRGNTGPGAMDRDPSSSSRSLSTDSQQTPPTSPLLMSITSSQQSVSPSGFMLDTSEPPPPSRTLGGRRSGRCAKDGKNMRERDFDNASGFVPSPLKGLRRGEAVTPESSGVVESGTRQINPSSSKSSGPVKKVSKIGPTGGMSSFPMKVRHGRRNSGQIRRDYLLNLGVGVPPPR